jgi:hypothetical protein
MLRASLLFVAGIILAGICSHAAQHFWHEAQASMTIEKYEVLCGKNASECYPEIGDFLLAFFYAAAAIFAGTLIISASVTAWRQLVHRLTRRTP